MTDGNLSLLTDRLEPEIRETFSSALLISDVSEFGSGKGFDKCACVCEWYVQHPCSLIRGLVRNRGLGIPKTSTSFLLGGSLIPGF